MPSSLNRLLGMPVIWQDRRLGYVERTVADIFGRRLAGVVVRKGVGAARWADENSVLLVGKNCVLLKRKLERMPDVPEPGVCRVFLPTGEYAGNVTDVWISRRNLGIVALEISPNPLARLAGRCSYAIAFQPGLNAEGHSVAVGQLLSWTQLKQHLKEEEDG